MPALNNAALGQLDAGVATPAYDRNRVTIGIVHFGVGGFHRAHQAMYLDELMNAGQALDFGICGVGVMPSDKRMADVMAAQDGLYTLVEKHADGTYAPRVIGSIIDYKFAPDNVEDVLATMAAETTKIVSLTVTEGGYNFHHVTGEFDFDNADVAHDLGESAVPKTTFGLVTEALRRRRAADRTPSSRPAAPAATCSPPWRWPGSCRTPATGCCGWAPKAAWKPVWWSATALRSSAWPSGACVAAA